MTPKTPTKKQLEEKLSETDNSKRESGSGKYRFDRKLGRLVKVSDRIPGVSARGESAGAEAGPCGRTECGGGSCAMDDLD